MSQPIGVCIVVIKDEKVLLGLRRNAYRAGMYGLPGGRIEVGEGTEVAARRELFEETNLSAVRLEYLGVVKEHQGTYDFVHFGFVCHEYSGDVVTKELDKCEKWEWFDLHHLPKNILPGHLVVIDMAKSQKINALRDL